METVLITGGAGFIGSHLADELLRHGYAVRALDDLVDQVHPDGDRPAYLDDDVELVTGDVRDPGVVARALRGTDVVVHLAARVGVGQSMYELAEYTSVNTVGTAVLLEAIAARRVRKLVVASSMSVYGEGAYETIDGQPVSVERTPEHVDRGLWDVRDARGRPLRPVPTPETKRPALASVYALTKYDQERLCLVFGTAYDVPVVALRLFNTYGPRQSLSNPYTGVLAIFASRLMNGRPPLVFEDGLQLRDFVAVSDVVRAARLALESDRANGHAINVGTGRGVSVLEVAETLRSVLGTDVQPEVTGECRAGDIRHCFADVSLAKDVLGFEAEVDLGQGIAELVAWLEGQVGEDRVEAAAAELAERGLTRAARATGDTS
ncbi:MAG TPA: NAD-dependent epimerase/dehydratase family protein [Actinomycetota bacterium]|nr:NAD-dependent epimerase/dehydratase family protein [Actinomycetota bacterium]